MPIKPLSLMSNASTLGGGEILYAQQSGSDVQVTANQISTFVYNGAPPSRTIAQLAALNSFPNGTIAYASNGRKIGEGAGLGTGILVYYSANSWRTLSSDQVALA
jgi:hypothetical protein